MDKSLLFVGAGALLLLYAFKKRPGNSAPFDFGQLTQSYDSANVTRLINLADTLANSFDPNTGDPLSRFQIQLLLSQALLETGLFTSNPNYKNMDQDNNYAGITHHGSYPADSYGTYAVYPDLQSFANDWINILNHGTQPIEANSVSDFVNRLKQNGYFEDDVSTYLANVNSYYNLLSQI